MADGEKADQEMEHAAEEVQEAGAAAAGEKEPAAEEAAAAEAPEAPAAERAATDAEADGAVADTTELPLPPPPPLGASGGDANGAETSKGKETDKDRDRKKDRREKEHRRSRSRSRDRRDKDRKSRSEERGGKDKDKDKDKDKKERHRERSRSRERGARDRDFRRPSRRSRSRDRSDRKRSRSRSRDRPRRERSRSRSRRGRSRSRSSSMSGDGLGGYVPRRRQQGSKAQQEREPEAPISGYVAANDPFFYMRNTQVTTSEDAVNPAAATAAALRLWQEQQLKSRQLVLQQQAASLAAAQSKTQREQRQARRMYVGNLPVGLVNDFNLRQAFNAGMAASNPALLIPGNEPVANVSVHSDGRYGFVEFKNMDLATASLALNGMQLFGQSITVERPSGYTDPALTAAQASYVDPAASAVQQAAAALMAYQGLAPVQGLPPPPAGGVLPTLVEAGASLVPTPFLSVTGMVTATVLADDAEYKEVMEDLKEECSRHGAVYEVKVPRPPIPAMSQALFGQGNFGKAYVQFVDTAGAKAAKEAIHGRLFAGQTVQAVYVTAQAWAGIMG